MDKSYFIRFTPTTQNIYDLGMLKFVLDDFEPTKYVIGKEQASSEHFHIAVWGIKVTPEVLRYQLKKRLEGQIYISGKEIVEKIKAIAYCLKDGNYTTKGLEINEFLQASSISKRKVKFDDLLKQAEEDYNGDDKRFVRKLIEAHVATNKKVYLQHIKAQLLLTKLKKEQYGTYKEYLVEKIIDLC